MYNSKKEENSQKKRDDFNPHRKENLRSLAKGF